MTENIKVEVIFDRSTTITPELRDAIYAEIVIAGHDLRDDAADQAPWHDEGRIPDSLMVEEHRDDLEVLVGAGGKWAFLARFHEFGTVHLPEHPFMEPATENLRAEYPDRLAEVTNAVIEEV